MNRFYGLAFAALAATAPLATAGTATFGLFTKSWFSCGHCESCPGPYNAFSPKCYGVENAAGCTACAPGYGHYPSGGQDDGFGYSRGWHGLQAKKFFGLCGHGRGAPSHFDMPQAPCGYIAAFHGVPGGLGCGDPFGGCGTKRPLFRRICDWHKKSTDDTEIAGHGFGKGFFAKLKDKYGRHKVGGGSFEMDGAYESSDLFVTTSDAPAPCAGCTSSNVAPGPAPSALPLPSVQQMGYYPQAAYGYHPAAYQGYYYPQGYYQAPWGYYPAYGYPMGY